MSKHIIDKNAVLLVLAPRFPSINQPWMDTYLEQLQHHEITFKVIAENKSPRKYHEKVDRIGLGRHIIPVLMENINIIYSSLLSSLFHPRVTLSLARITWTIFHPKLKFSVSLKSMLQVLHCSYCISHLEQLKLIHSHSELFCYYFLPISVQRRIPLILTFHGLLPHGLLQLSPVRRQLLGDYAVCILVNTNAAKQQAVTLGYPEEKIKVLPQGLPLEEFPFVSKPAPQHNETVQLLTVGRYHRDKGHAYALLALRRLIDRGVDAHWHFVGVGPDKKRLNSFVQKIGLIERVTFHENLDQAAKNVLYQQCNLFILPSLNDRTLRGPVETQGVVLQEAQASGCIPIATRVGGIPECINDKEDGLLVPDRSHRAIADAICYLLARPEQWPSYQTKGRRNVEERFSADVIGERMAKLLTEVMVKGHFSP